MEKDSFDSIEASAKWRFCAAWVRPLLRFCFEQHCENGDADVCHGKPGIVLVIDLIFSALLLLASPTQKPCCSRCLLDRDT